MFSARTSHQRSILLDRHLQQQKLYVQDKITGDMWIRRLLKFLLQSFFDLWEERNNIVHGQDVLTRKQKRRNKLIQEIKTLHQKESSVLARDRDIFITSDPNQLDTILANYTPTYLQNWIQVWKPVINHSVKQARDYAIRSVKTLKHYFPKQQDNPTLKRSPKPRQSVRSQFRHDKPHNRKRRSVTLPLRHFLNSDPKNILPSS